MTTNVKMNLDNVVNRKAQGFNGCDVGQTNADVRVCGRLIQTIGTDIKTPEGAFDI